ncbi:N-acetylmuramoyl-L-alanine amidase family protein [Alkalithermobacter paradoxus]|uniref:N-acetylmuramoyl-L-alanine amidase AmiC n=1 Tax=Alkalithermobacter paradoxus TaxID=29349 RepID=A0A1V4I9W9_9FIRM|nr:N-acetylmuramoyl-L-alanine amidase AmiC precursor [[Clostridium] thermoalcaliphilum]
MKKILSLFACVLLIFISSFTSAFGQSNQIRAIVDGRVMTLQTVQIRLNGVELRNDVPPVILNNRTLVPVRIVSESLGAKVEWNSITRTVTITRDDKIIILTIDNSRAQVNGKSITLPDNVPAKLVNGRTMVPVRFVSDELGLDVGWNDVSRTVILNTRIIQFNNINVSNNEVRLRMSENVIYRHAVYSNPHRLVVDIDNTRMNLTKTNYDGVGALIKGVRMSQFQSNPLVSRVVIDLNEAPKYSIDQRNNEIIIRFDYSVNASSENAKYLIAIDAGHGGTDPGAIGVERKLREKDFNLDIAKRLDEMFRNNGYRTLMTRSEDVFVALSERAAMANQNNADVFVSIHANSFTNPSVSGIETLYYPNNGDRANGRDNETLARMIQEELIKETNAIDRKIKERPNLLVLNSTNMPAALVELGFLSNPQEEALLDNNEYKNKLVRALYNAIVRYIKRDGV